MWKKYSPRGAVDLEVLLVEVPAARPDDECRGPLRELVRLALGAGEVDLPLDRVDEVLLALDEIAPGRRVRVLEVGHVDGGPRVQRVDHHLAIGRAGDLDLADLQIVRHVRHAPVGGALRGGLGREREARARAQCPPALLPRSQQLAPRRLDLTMETREEVLRLACEQLFGDPQRHRPYARTAEWPDVSSWMGSERS